MAAELRKNLDYVVLTSDPAGDEHGKTPIQRIRTNSLKILELTIAYINKTPEITAWLNTGDIDDIYQAVNDAASTGRFNPQEFLYGNQELYHAMNEIYSRCRLPLEKRLVVLGNHDIPATFFTTVNQCVLVGADIASLAQAMAQKSHQKPITPITLCAEINNRPIIGAMNTIELPSNVPKELHPLFPHLGMTNFYSNYPKIYTELLEKEYYLMSHKGIIDEHDALRKETDPIHEIAMNSLASFEAHFHQLMAKKYGKTVRFISGTNHILVIGLNKQNGQPEHYTKIPFV